MVKYLPALGASGVRCHLREPLPAFASALFSFERGSLPQKTIYYALFFFSRLGHILGAARYDVVVVQRDLFPLSPGFMEKLLQRVNPAIVYDTDDLMHLAPRFAAGSMVYRFRSLEKFNAIMKDARHVVVANDIQRDHARSLNERSTVIPMVVDYDRYASEARPVKPDEPSVLGWTGTAVGFNYLAQLREPLERIAARRPIELHVVSGAKAPVDMGAVPIVRKSWRLETEVVDLKHFDVGLIPLTDEPFERGKFPFKAVQYMAAGVPVVASPVGMTASLIEHGTSGFLASTPEEWERYVEQLLGEPELRAAFAREGQRIVREQYSVDRWVPVWESILREVADGTGRGAGSADRQAGVAA